MTLVRTPMRGHRTRSIPSVLHQVVLAILLAVTSTSVAQEPPAKELQRRAGARIASYREHVRKTGDKASRADDLKEAIRELDEACRVFLAMGNTSEGAACRVEAADALRLQSKFEEALKVYAEAETLARKIKAPVHLARALI